MTAVNFSISVRRRFRASLRAPPVATARCWIILRQHLIRILRSLGILCLCLGKIFLKGTNSLTTERQVERNLFIIKEELRPQKSRHPIHLSNSISSSFQSIFSLKKLRPPKSGSPPSTASVIDECSTSETEGSLYTAETSMRK